MIEGACATVQGKQGSCAIFMHGIHMRKPSYVHIHTQNVSF